MKKFSLAPLSIAVTVSLLAFPTIISHTAFANTPKKLDGDLSIYTPSTADKSPTILLMVEGSTFTNYSDIRLSFGNVEIIGTPDKSDKTLYPNSLPVYDRNYYYQSLDPLNNKRKSYTRLTRMKDAIYYLMDTEGVIPDDYRVGIGRYSSGTLGNQYNGDSLTGSVNVPAMPLGPVSESNNPNSQRYKIKKFVAEMCATDRLCTGNAPMASAYAEAGAYMMGTLTAPLSKTEGESFTQRVLRRKVNTWQYCPPANRRLQTYVRAGGSTEHRLECDDNSWVTINGDNVAPFHWTATVPSMVYTPSQAPTEKPTDKKIEKIQGKTDYDLLWYPSSNPAPYGISGSAQGGWSPSTYSWRNYHFKEDIFHEDSPTDTNPAGVNNNYTYYYDETLKPKTHLQPDFQYRILRKRYDALKFKEFWQYCPKDKAQLVNYVYSSYRYMCKEEDWIPIDRHNMEQYGFERAPLWVIGDRPYGVDVEWNTKFGHKFYLYDALRHPNNGWDYYYDNKFPDGEKPALPKTLSNGYSVSGIRNAPPEVRHDKKYTYTPPKYSECSGQAQYDSTGQLVGHNPQTINNAIFFLTAAWPESRIAMPLNEMNMSLTKDAPKFSTHNAVGGNMTGAECDASGLKEKVGLGVGQISGTDFPHNSMWHCMGAYSRRLNSTKNPLGIPIKTGVFTFVSNNERLPIKSYKNGVPLFDCKAGRNISLQNACKLGQYGEGYGEGGFFLSGSDNIEDSYKELGEAISKMAQNLNDDLGVVPTGMPTVPANPLQPNALLDTGYLGLLAPQPDKSQAMWQGNLRKYKQKGGAYVDKDNKSPFSNLFNALLSIETRDYWAASDRPFPSAKQQGGVFDQIPMPKIDTTDTPRRIYLSENQSGTKLTRISPTVDGSSNSIAQVSVNGIANDNQDELRTLLLNYMGYTIQHFVSGTTKTQDITKTFSSGSNKAMGGINHSTPIVLISRAKKDTTTGKYAATHQYVLFGAMDNALHVINDHTGEEVLSYFPREVLSETEHFQGEQYKAITPILTMQNGPAAGVDASWTSYVHYTNKDNFTVLEADQLYAYGGTRLGAKAYYGLDFTGIHQNKDPKQLFTITPNTTHQGKEVFKRLGYTWGKPVITKIKWQGKPKLVAILTGGYDRSYDRTDDQRNQDGNAQQTTIGNAIYIVDAQNGQPLIVASNSMTNLGHSGAGNADHKLVNCKDTDLSGSAVCSSYDNENDVIPVVNSHLKFSVASSVKAFDRDADELTDAIYFGDLNGQVFRLDINNASSKILNPGKSDETKTNPSVRLVRLANLNTTSDKAGPRFYEAPIATIHVNNEGERFAVIGIASGDRSNPLLAPTDSNKFNHVYAIYDKDIGQISLYHPNYNFKTTNIQIDTVDFPLSPTSLNASNYNKKGWFSPLDKATTYTKHGISETIKSNAIKAFGPLAAVNNKLFVSAYNPDDGHDDKTGCTAQVRGTTETYQFCLPYGICTEGGSLDAQHQRFRTGKGIQSIVFGGTGEDNTGRVMLTATPPQNDGTDNVSAAPPQPLNSAGPDVVYKLDFLGRLRPMSWYDQQSKRD